MSERDGFGPGVPCWVDTWQPDAAGAAAFYAGLFGWETETTDAPPGARRTAVPRRGRDAPRRWRPAGDGPDLPVAWGTYVEVASADDTVAAATAAGGSVAMAPFESLDGGRMAVIVDPVGAALGVWQLGRHGGAQVVNEPNAWAMSVLLCDDPEPARAFYAAVFGWQAEPFMLATRRARSGVFQATSAASRAARAPRRRRGAGAGLRPPRSVGRELLVDDADATAAAAPGLGGTVVAGPFDTAISRDASSPTPAAPSSR